jgi:hypothetical protein
LSGGLFARANETDALVSTSTTQIYFAATLKTNWTNKKITLYRTTGGAVRLEAKREVITEQAGLHTFDVDVFAFVDPDTGNAWVGHSLSSFGDKQAFYLETESGIHQAAVVFGKVALGAVMPYQHDVTNGIMAFGHIYWDGSFVEKVKRGENADAVIEQFNKTNDLKSVATGMRRERITFIEDSLNRVETGLNPWFFLDERHGSQFAMTTIEAIDVSVEKLRLDLKNPAGDHKASVWIDLKTWKVVKVVQDGKP